jgi:hypothetical protein
MPLRAVPNTSATTVIEFVGTLATYRYRTLTQFNPPDEMGERPDFPYFLGCVATLGYRRLDSFIV